MQEIQYKTFSLRTHEKNWRRNMPNACQFELTFRCGLHCKHCYTDCYNNIRFQKKELNTKAVKDVLDRIYRAGVVWLCFTGGDPLVREDFLDIYDFAKEKGFIISIFSNGCSMTKKMIRAFKKRPPFVIELTLNAVSKKRFEALTQVKGSFTKTMEGIRAVISAGLPLKIKTMLTTQNFEELKEIKQFVAGLGVPFSCSANIHGRLNGDTAPCLLRVSVEDLLAFENRVVGLREECVDSLQTPPQKNAGLFSCAITTGDGIYLDPCGNIFPCNLIRRPFFNVLTVDFLYARKKLLSWARKKAFTRDTKCRDCLTRSSCSWCPGKALVETADMQSPLDYCCELTRRQHDLLQQAPS